ncbi:MAG: AMP-binding protein, partial [Bdellovibrionales bacterium]|nr:AMP-binding protein [Bdellovibrionales bacterium]
MTIESIESVLHENRKFAPPSCEKAGAPRWLIDSEEEYERLYRQSIEDPEAFYGTVAKELHWFEPWQRVLEYKTPDAKWFVGGKTNLCYNAVDRQVEAGYGDSLAIIWEGEPYDNNHPEVRTLTYRDLQKESAKFGNALKKLGVAKGDVVTIYMGMIPELAIAVLACARIGAVHSVIFGGFSAQAIADRVADANSKVIVTCDGLFRKGATIPLKENVDKAIYELGATHVESVVYVKRCGNRVKHSQEQDHTWEALMKDASEDCPCEALDSEAMSFLLYTSGSTGKPKGIQHTIGGYMVHTYLSAKYVFNLIPDMNQVYWCTADIGWITGHSYIIYGILPNRVPSLMYEGAPTFPHCDRFWDIVERHKVTQFYTAPTAIRAFMKFGEEYPKKHDLSSLQVLGTVGEPINPEAWIWYHKVIGGERCPIVDTYWQTET